MMDSSERKWARQRLELEYAVTRLLAGSRTLGEAVHNVLQTVCETLDWNRGELWNVDRPTQTLECVETWHAASPFEDALDRVTRRVTLAGGVDLPGRAWASGSPVEIIDLAADEDFPRARAVRAAGLRGGFAFPIRCGPEVLGVLAFYRGEVPPPDADLLPMFAAIGDQIAQLIERKRGEQALRESEERFRSLSACSPVGIFQSDPRGYCTYANPCCQSICGCTLEESLGDGWTRFVHPDDRDRTLEAWFTAALKGRRFDGEVRFGTPQGGIRWVRMRSAPMLSGKGELLGYVGTVEDITERKRSDEALRRLPQRLLEAQETERKRVARELHDSVIQLLSSAKFRLLPAAASASGRSRPERRDEEKALALLDRSIQEVRRISQNLRPSELDDFGLAAAVRSLCDEFRERTGLDLKLKQTRFPRKLPAEVELSLYRLIQEALNNVEKHARATRVAVLLTGTPSGLELTIRDDGSGFEFPPADGKRSVASGFGLVDMKERAALAKGDFTITSAPGHGTEIAVRIPISSGSPAGSP